MRGRRVSRYTIGMKRVIPGVSAIALLLTALSGTPSLFPGTVALAAQNAPVQSGGLLPLPAATDPGAQKAGQLLEQMVRALGGQAWLNVQDTEEIGRTFSFYHGESQGAGALYRRMWQWPDKERIEIAAQQHGWGFIGGLPIPPEHAKWIIIYAGDKAHEITDRGSTAVETTVLEDYLRRRQHSLRQVLRTWLKEPGIALLYEGQEMVDRRQADKITILSAQNDGATISIDTVSHLPVKVSFTWRDPKTRYRTEEAESYASYREVQGLMMPFNISRSSNGEVVSQRFVTEMKWNQNPPATMFDPKAAVVGASDKTKSKKK